MMTDQKPRQSTRSTRSDTSITIDGANYDITNLVGGAHSASGSCANTSGKQPTVRRFSRRGSAMKRSSLTKRSHHYPQLGQTPGFNLYSTHHKTDFDNIDGHPQEEEAAADAAAPPAFSWTQYEDPSFAWDGQEEEKARMLSGGRSGAGGNMFAIHDNSNNYNLNSLRPKQHQQELQQDRSHQYGYGFAPPPPKATRRMSSMSSISMSIHTMDCPGLTELNESISSFSDHYYEESLAEAMAVSNLQKEEEDCQEIEIEPGVYLPFRGSDETWEAIKTGRASSITCFDCTIELIATIDCQYAICPQCHTVNPIDYCISSAGNTTATTSCANRGSVVHFGVVMGFKKDWCGDYYDRVIKQQQQHH